MTKESNAYNEEELRKLEEQLRSLPTPYSSNEPDERYFANFRVRVFERIDSKAAPVKPSLVAQVVAWFAASPIRGLAIGMAVVIVALGSVWMFGASNTPELRATTAEVATPAVPQRIANQAVATTLASAVSKDIASTQVLQPSTTHSAVVSGVSPTKAVDELFAEIDTNEVTPAAATLVGGADDPVDLSTLSHDELLAVLDGIRK